MLWNIWCLNEQNAQTTKTVKEFEKVHSTVAHQQSPTKAQTQNNKVLLLPYAEFIIVLLSLPF